VLNQFTGITPEEERNRVFGNGIVFVALCLAMSFFHGNEKWNAG